MLEGVRTRWACPARKMKGVVRGRVGIAVVRNVVRLGRGGGGSIWEGG